MNLRKIPALLMALFLQFAPLVRTIEPAVAGVLQPVLLLLRWASAATAVAGGAHALSGATGLVTATTVRATNGIATTSRAQITSNDHGNAQSYSATGLPPGILVTSSTAGIISGTPTQAGTFSTLVTGWENSNRTGRSYTASVTFTVVETAPTITSPPASTNILEGRSVTLSVTATGTSLAYRWLHNGIEIPTGTSATLTLNPVKLSDAGDYQVRVQNTGGAILSATAKLTVTPAAIPPTFTVQPNGRSVHTGENLTLTANATAASGSVTYSWTKDGAVIPGTNPSLVLNALSAAQAGSYRAIATANALSATSAPAVVTVVGPLSTSVVPASAGFKVQINSIAGRQYFLESATDPAAASWTPVANSNAAGASLQLTDTNNTPEVRLYRARVGP